VALKCQQSTSCEALELFLLQHAEALFLVNHDESEIFERDVVLHMRCVR